MTIQKVGPGGIGNSYGARTTATPYGINASGVSHNVYQAFIPTPGVTHNRPPDLTDNASRGYTINSIWQAGGKLYKPVSAPDSNSATWAVLPTVSGCFADVMGDGAIFAGGFTAQKQGYVGKAVELTATIGGSPVVTDVDILADGNFDNLTARSIMTQADAGTIVTVTKIYDHTGNNNTLTKSASYLAPILEWSDVLQSYCINDVAGNTGTVRTLQFPAGVITSGALSSGFGVVGNSCTIFAVGQGVNSADSGKCALFALGDQTNPTVADRRSLTTMTTQNGFMNISKNGSNQIFVPAISLDSQPSVLVSSLGNVNSVLSVNEDIGTVPTSGGANDTNVYTSGWLNCITPTLAGYHSTHRLIAFGVANTAATVAQQQKLRYASYCRYDIRPQVLNRVFAIGDSRTAKISQGANQIMDNWVLQLASRLGRDYRVYGMGNSGMQALQILTAQLPQILSLYTPNVENVAFYLAGVNDISTAAASPVDTQGYIKNACSQLKSKGFRVNLFNELATTATGNQVDQKLPVLRGLINTAGPVGMSADNVIDLLKYAPFTIPTNTAFYPDGLHQTQALDTMIASVAYPYVTYKHS